MEHEKSMKKRSAESLRTRPAWIIGLNVGGSLDAGIFVRSRLTSTHLEYSLTNPEYLKGLDDLTGATVDG